MSGDFHGDLSIEPVVGVRVFRVDDLGRLRGVTHQDIWRPGENVAACYAPGPQLPSVPMDLALLQAPPSYVDFHVPFHTAKAQRRKARKADVRMKEWKDECQRLRDEWEGHGLDKCDHGFWAYYTPQSDYASPDKVYGVVEGYGQCVIGTKGFRASKARIVALSLPPATDEMHGYRLSLVQRNYPDVPTYPSLARMLTEHPLSHNPEPDGEDFWTEPTHSDDVAAFMMQMIHALGNITPPQRHFYGSHLAAGGFIL